MFKGISDANLVGWDGTRLLRNPSMVVVLVWHQATTIPSRKKIMINTGVDSRCGGLERNGIRMGVAWSDSLF